MSPRVKGCAIAAAAALLVAGCGSEAADNKALACSIASNWAKARSDFEPQGQRSRRLSFEDRRLVEAPGNWRALYPGQDLVAMCDVQAPAPTSVKVSRDGDWAVADFSDEWSVERCLARREGDGWRERDCDVVMHVEPVLPATPDSG